MTTAQWSTQDQADRIPISNKPKIPPAGDFIVPIGPSGDEIQLTHSSRPGPTCLLVYHSESSQSSTPKGKFEELLPPLL
ncbi:hypothetical protein AMATHDRAFT_64352, partial [Amanita thiersii Skay4041]